MVALESRAETAENERAVAVEQMRAMTPRPGLSPTAALPSLLKGHSLAMLEAALQTCRHWPSEELAKMLVGDVSGGKSLMELAPQAFGCLATPLQQRSLSRTTALQAIQDGTVRPFAEHCTAQQLAWLQAHLARFPPSPASAQLVLNFLAGSSAAGYAYPQDLYGCLAAVDPGLTVEVVMAGIEELKLPTVQRVLALEAENRKLREEVEAFKAAALEEENAEARRQENKKAREVEAVEEKPSPVEVYLAMLADAPGEDAWKDGLLGMGTGPDVPKLFRCSGKVRNKHISKRETEKLVKEVWKEKSEEMRSGRSTDLVDFVFAHLQKKVGIVSAVVEMGYNFLYGLWKYSWDADCDLFLRILKGEVKEDVYLEQIQLQEELEALMLAVDKSTHGSETGTLSKTELRTALEAFFRVGEPGGKMADRFDALMQALDEDQEGQMVKYGKLFEEDREYNQGEFAEAVREQAVTERAEYFVNLQMALSEVAGYESEASRAHIVAALQKLDPDISDRQAWALANGSFPPGEEKLPIPVIMKRLKAGAIKSGRASTSKASVSGKLKLAVSKMKKVKQGAGFLAAVDAVRQQQISAASSKPGLLSAASAPAHVFHAHLQ
eukprot:jgi/Botrbrau1/21596/Bobra.43_1s0006.1